MSKKPIQSVAAQVTGVVIEINIAPGDAVSAGEVLMIIESMKMHMPLEAADGGVVDSIAVSPGDFVEEGQVVIVLASTS